MSRLGSTERAAIELQRFRGNQLSWLCKSRHWRKDAWLWLFANSTTARSIELLVDLLGEQTEAQQPEGDWLLEA